MTRLPLLLAFSMLFGLSAAVGAQSAPASTPIKNPQLTYSGSLHLVVNEDRSSDNVVLKWHPDYMQNADGKQSVRLSTVHYASISSSGRSNNVLECGATMGVAVSVDGATSAKLALLQENFPNGKFGFVVDDQVVAILDFVDGISKFKVVVPVTSDYQARSIENLVKRNNRP